MTPRAARTAHAFVVLAVVAALFAAPFAGAEPADWSMRFDSGIRDNAVYTGDGVTLSGRVSFTRESFEHGISRVEMAVDVLGQVPPGCPVPPDHELVIDEDDYEDPDRVEIVDFSFRVDTPCNGRFEARVRAFAGGPIVEDGDAEESPTLGVTFDVINPPPPPRNVDVTVDGPEVTATWDGAEDPPPDFGGYILERAPETSEPAPSTTSTTRATSTPTTEPAPTTTTTTIDTSTSVTTTSSTTPSSSVPGTSLPAREGSAAKSDSTVDPDTSGQSGQSGGEAATGTGGAKAAGAYEVVGITGPTGRTLVDEPGEGTWHYRVRAVRPSPGPDGSTHTVLSEAGEVFTVEVDQPATPPPGGGGGGGGPTGGTDGGGPSGGGGGGGTSAPRPRRPAPRIPISPSGPLDVDIPLRGFLETLPFDISSLAADGSLGEPDGSLDVFFEDDDERRRELRQTLIPVAGALVLAVGAGQLRYLTAQASRP